MRTTVVSIPAVTLFLLLGCGGGKPMPAGSPAAAAAGVAAAQGDPAASRHGAYVQRNLVSDGTVPAEQTDANLVNAWGLDALPTSPWWIADNGQAASTLYDGEGIAQPVSPGPLVVSLPGAAGPAAPTGLVANAGGDFIITLGGATGPARFLFASEDGTLSAWMRTSPVSTSAVVVADASTSGASFKGLALAATPSGSRLYATDFHNGLVRAWDGGFGEVSLPAGAFVDPRIPAGFAPFGIRAIHGVVLVTYAMQDVDRHDDVKGPGLGFVDAYSVDGALLARVASRGKLNAPWGLALAPAGFGPHARRLLVGNFGDGRILSFGVRGDHGKGRDQARGGEDGGAGDGAGEGSGEDDDLDDDGFTLRDAGGPIAIDGLWGLSFGNGATAGPATALFFTAGPADEAGGLFGRIDFAPGSAH
jgi:uncharacterized protein (TIGR03118 family)